MSCPQEATNDGISLRKLTEKAEFFNNGCQTSTTQTTTVTTVDINKRVWLKFQNHWRTLPWERLKTVKWKNERAKKSGKAYTPTEIENIANVLSHGIWVLPAAYATLQLLLRSHNTTQTLAALIYGISLSSLFFISTCYHSAFYCQQHTQLRDTLHRCDRAMIYIFIAGSYYPWLSLGDPLHPTLCFAFKWAVWILAALGILYQQVFHERFKTLETVFYVIMGVGPSVVMIIYGREFVGMAELKLGGLIYILGIIFFKADGIIPFAHSIWHLFVVFAACVHYYAILNYLYSE